jgi:hypothetical protein
MKTTLALFACVLLFIAGCHRGNPLTRLSDEALGDKCVWVDWREEEESIIKSFAEPLAAADKLEAVPKGDDLWFRYHDQEYKLPLTQSPHDRSVAISSLVEILKDNYDIRLLKWSKDTDSRAFLILPKAAWSSLEQENPAWAQSHFEAVAVGTDIFGKGEPVPYVHRDNP